MKSDREIRPVCEMEKLYGSCHEDDAVDDGEDDNPRESCAVDEEASEDGWVSEEHDGPCEDLPDGRASEVAVEDTQRPDVRVSGFGRCGGDGAGKMLVLFAEKL